MDPFAKSHSYWMQRALREAERAFEANEVPVGAIVVRADQVVGRGHNMVEQLRDPTAHAEIIAVTAACETLGSRFLENCTLYVTLEPCPMCAGALVLARLERLVFAAMDEKAGAASTLYNIPQDPRLNHRVEVLSGVEEQPAADLLREFFRKRRAQTKAASGGPEPGIGADPLAPTTRRAARGDGATGMPPDAPRAR